MVSQRSLHRLAEQIYEELERDGYFDSEHRSERSRSPRRRTRSQRALRPPPKPRRRATARSKAYGRAFKRLAPKYKKKNGGWKKDGFSRCVRAAHRACK